MATGVVTDTNGTLVLDELSAEDITALLSESRTKGEYMHYILDVVKSGKVYDVASAHFTGKEQSAIVQSLTLNIKKCKKDHPDTPELRIVKKGGNTILVNMAAHAAALEAAKATEDAS